MKLRRGFFTGLNEWIGFLRRLGSAGLIYHFADVVDVFFPEIFVPNGNGCVPADVVSQIRPPDFMGNLLHLQVDFARIWALMNRNWRFLCGIVCSCFVLFCPERATGGAEIDLVEGDRVVFLGGTIFERDRLYGELETALTAHFWGRKITFRNLGWDGDTVFGHARTGGRRGAVFGDVEEGFANLKKQIDKEKPTVIFVGYGAMEAHAGEEGLPAFRRGLTTLLSRLTASRRRFVLLTPLRVLGEDIPQRTLAASEVDQTNLKLASYADAIIEASKRRNAVAVDVFRAPDLLDADLRINGLHLSAKGYRALGRYLCDVECVASPAESSVSLSDREQLGALVRRKSELFYNYWRPRNDAFVFGERKSEQVPVQLELPQFEGLIAKLEERIQGLSR